MPLLLLAGACVASDGSAEPPPAQLVRDGARPSVVRRGDLDGDGVGEVVVASVSETPGAFGLPTPYLEVFANREDDWQRVFDATGNAPAGGHSRASMLEPADDELAVGQAIEVLELADLAHDGASELVAAISNVGATAGPLELWIVSMGPSGALLTEYYFRTERGGKVALTGDRVAIEFGVYRKDDPGCCPSSLEVRYIGHDPESGTIRVLKRERTRLDTP
ncbi:MAG: hypothetical protein ACRDHM_11310 [Actinomycetota bacterium]